MSKLTIQIAVAIGLTMTIFTACTNNDRTSDDTGVLVAVGQASLTADDLNSAIPPGLGYDDSVKYAHAYIRNWIDAQLVSEIAASEIDMTEIDKLVEQYRKELIMWEYSKQMYDSHKDLDLPEDTVKGYYQAHRDEFLLKRPMVKGVYVKLSDNSAKLEDYRRNYKSNKSENLDRMEKDNIGGDVVYEYFGDRWVDWDQIESLIPYDFGTSAEAWLRGQRSVDTDQGGFVYLLNISDVLFTGQQMPYEVARPLILDRLKFHNKRAYDLLLKDLLYTNAVNSGKVRINCDLPTP